MSDKSRTTWSSSTSLSQISFNSNSNDNSQLQSQHPQQQQQHSEFILNGLQTLKTKNILCDVTLIAQNKRFQVHKILLASVSDYFRSMFTSGMKESTQTDIELKGVSSKGLEKLIEILYTSKTTFESHTDLFEVISSANHLQCLLVLDYCERNFLNRLTCKNFNYFIQMAKMYRMQNALKQIDLFIVNNLAQIINQTKHNNKRFKLENDQELTNCTDIDLNQKLINDSDNDSYLNEDNTNNNNNVNDDDDDESDLSTGLYSLSYKQLLKCLSYNNLKLKEIDLFMLTWQWINESLFRIKKFKLKKTKYKHSYLETNLNTRVRINETKFKRKIDIIRSLMKHIRFGLISPNDLINKVQMINKLMLNDKYLRNLVLNALNYHLTPMINLNKNFNLNINLRSPINSILIIGGREINPFPSIHDSCFVLNDLYELDTNYNQINNKINHSTTSLIRKIPITSLPNNLSHMQCVLVDNNFLYVIGGCLSQCAHGESAIGTVYRYDPRLNNWTISCSMLEKRAYFYACSLSSSQNNQTKKFIFSFGGKNKDGSLNTVEKYDMETNTWSYSQSLRSTYYAHSGIVLNNKAYISGGYTHGHFTSDLNVFDPNTEQWQELRQMNISRGWHTMCVFNDLLYVFGGCNLNSNQSNQTGQQIAQPITITEFYSIQTDQWTMVRPMINLHKEASCFKMNNFVFIFGGYNIAAKTGQKLISKYDLVNDLWYTVGQLPSGMTGVGCCLIDLPWYLIEKDISNCNNYDLNVTNNQSNLNSTQSNQIKKNDYYLNDDLSEDDLEDKTTSYISDESEDDDDDDAEVDDFIDDVDE